MEEESKPYCLKTSGQKLATSL